MRLLDAFCGVGGAADGYHRAGFDVVGVDKVDQPRYPYPFVKGDAVEFIRDRGAEFDVIHASPPCQRHTTAAVPEVRQAYPDLIGATRAAILATGRPYVIENVVGARSRLVDPVTLCGSMFGLILNEPTWGIVQLRRHRLFESSAKLTAPGPCQHYRGIRVASVSGKHSPNPHKPNGVRHADNTIRPSTQDRARLLGLDRPGITLHEVNQAIPPAYTNHLGVLIMRALLTEWAAS